VLIEFNIAKPNTKYMVNLDTEFQYIIDNTVHAVKTKNKRMTLNLMYSLVIGFITNEV
jgi:hypothetical protein